MVPEHPFACNVRETQSHIARKIQVSSIVMLCCMHLHVIRNDSVIRLLYLQTTPSIEVELSCYCPMLA